MNITRAPTYTKYVLDYFAAGAPNPAKAAVVCALFRRIHASSSAVLVLVDARSIPDVAAIVVNACLFTYGNRRPARARQK